MLLGGWDKDDGYEDGFGWIEHVQRDEEDAKEWDIEVLGWVEEFALGDKSIIDGFQD